MQYDHLHGVRNAKLESLTKKAISTQGRDGFIKPGITFY